MVENTPFGGFYIRICCNRGFLVPVGMAVNGVMLNAPAERTGIRVIVVGAGKYQLIILSHLKASSNWCL